MKVEKTKYPGIYKIGENYYIDFYGNGKRHRRVVGPNLNMAVEEKARMKKKNRVGKYHIVERMQKTTFGELFGLYKKEEDAKDYILQFEATYLTHFGGEKLASITQSDLFAFRDKVKALEHAKKAAELSKEKNAEILDTLGMAYFINGHVKEAIDAENKALKLEPYNDEFKGKLKEYDTAI